MPDDILLTGATGYIGKYLLRIWLEKSDRKIRLLARSRAGVSARQRIVQSLQEISSPAEMDQWTHRWSVFEGDVAEDHLGLTAVHHDELFNGVTEIIHCAAAARFDLTLEEARRTNVSGVEHFLDSAAQIRGFKRFHYIGTAYVAGIRQGRVLESELDTGQEHRNTYERSKFEAEIMLRSRMTDIPITIYRPSVVICDSQTGQASDHNGVYRVLRMYLQHRLPFLPGEPDSLLDLIPVDYVCEAIFRLANSRNAVGGCFHITAGQRGTTTLRDIQELSSRYSGSPEFRLISKADFDLFIAGQTRHLPEAEQKLLGELAHYLPYLFCRMWFDNSNTVAETGLTAPPVREYFPRFINHLATEISTHSNF